MSGGGSTGRFDTTPLGYEYLDHTADVQIHAWAPSLKEAYEQSAIAMLGYMTELDTIDVDDDLEPFQASIQSEDLESMLYDFLEEILFIFTTEFLIFKTVEITEFDTTNFRLEFTGYGEQWDQDKHPQGTEVKAITYSAMKIYTPSTERKAEIFVIVDI